MTIHPTLSVVMSNYNHAHYIKDALNAILAQSYTPIEFVILDDASTDNSYEILEDYARRYPLITLLRNERNMGIISNATWALDMVKGTHVYFAAADDKILPGFLEKSMNLLTIYPQAGLCSTHTICIDERGKNKGVLLTPSIPRKRCYISPEKTLSLLHKHGSWMQGNAVIYRRRALIDSGGFIPELHSFIDGFIHMVIAAKYGVCFIPEPLAAWRQFESSYSATCGKDPELFLQIIHHASELMSSRYVSLFPPDFVERWERREVLNNKLLRFNNLQATAFEDFIKMIPSKDLIDYFLFGLRKVFKNIEYVFLKCYLYQRNRIPISQFLIQIAKSYLRFFLK